MGTTSNLPSRLFPSMDLPIKVKPLDVGVSLLHCGCSVRDAWLQRKIRKNNIDLGIKVNKLYDKNLGKKNIEHTQQQKTHEFLVFQYFCGISKLSWLWLSSFILDQGKKNAKKSPRFRDRYRASLRGCRHGTWCKGVHHRLTKEAHDAGTAHHHRATGWQMWHGHRLPLKWQRPWKCLTTGTQEWRFGRWCTFFERGDFGGYIHVNFPGWI